MKKLLYILLAVAFLPFTSCLKDDDVDYTEWMNRNTKYYDNALAQTDPSGNKVFELYTPEWAKGCPVLIQWHNQRNLNAIRPMDNSVCDIIYVTKDIDGKILDNSYSNTVYGDSIYRTKPLGNITGFWAALTQMSEGDSVTVITPSVSAYGMTGRGNVKPYSTLIFGIKLKKIVSWELPS